MSKRAKEAAWKLFPIQMVEPVPLPDGDTIEVDVNRWKRVFAKIGYEQAEKDIVSLIETRISEILGDAQPNPVLRMELQGIIDKIKNCI